jgi:TatD DNase family protein
MFIDCHVHLDSFSDTEIGDILERGRDVGVQAVISAGTTLSSTKRAVELTEVYPDFFAGVGIHPMDITEPFTDDTYSQLKEMALSTEKVLVVSEVGLDFMKGAPDRADQYHAFREQIRLARDLKMPIVFHSRESHEEVFRILREERAYEVGGVMHYFQGDAETARKVIDLGFYISLARPLLRFSYLQEAAAEIPLANIVLETDSAPQPFKSKRENWTEPRHVAIVAQRLAELQDVPISEIEEITTRNMRTVLGGRWDVIGRHIGAHSAS